MSAVTSAEPVAILGLGRFGRALAEALTAANIEVLAVDSNPLTVRDLAPVVTLAVEADVTSREALAQLGVGEYSRAVVAIGSKIESSILCASALIDLEVPEIWAKAINSQQARILHRLGVANVVFPELDMGYRLAHTLTGHRSEFMPTVDGFAYAVVPAEREHIDHRLGEAQPFGDRGIRVLAVVRGGRGLPEVGFPETIVRSGDFLLIAGPASEVEQISP